MKGNFPFFEEEKRTKVSKAASTSRLHIKNGCFFVKTVTYTPYLVKNSHFHLSLKVALTSFSPIAQNDTLRGKQIYLEAFFSTVIYQKTPHMYTFSECQNSM